MHTTKFVTSLIVSVFLLGLCALLAGAAFELETYGPKGGPQAGWLPQLVVISVVILSALSFSGDGLRKLRGTRSREEEPEAEIPARSLIVIGGSVILMLGAYVFLWRQLPFPVITAGFFLLVSLVLAPASARNLKGYAIIALTSLLFSIGVWLVFTYALKVPLR